MKAWILAVLLLMIGASVSDAQDFRLKPNEVLNEAKNDIQDFVSNPAKRVFLNNVAHSQLVFRQLSNFNGYENETSGFVNAMFENLYQTFNEKTLAVTIADASQVDTSKLETAYEEQRSKYKEFLTKYSESIGVPVTDDWLRMNERAMAALAVLTAAQKKDQDESWFSQSWIWPFCERK